jgi:hypothetical protein
MKLGFSPALAAAQLDRLLVDDAYILTRSQARSAQGGTAFEYAKAADPIPCAVQPKAGGEYLGRGGRGQKESAGDRIDERRDDVIQLPAGTVVTQHDRLEVVGRGVYEVTLVPQRSTELLLEVEAREVTD